VWKVSWRKLDPPQERALTYQARLNAPLKSLIERTRKIFNKYPLAESPLEAIEQILFENTLKNFVDPEFPPNQESVSR
jgi:hypothetical protein